MNRKKPPFSWAFSLVEVLIIITVVTVISSLIFPHIGEFRDSARLSVARQQQAELQSALGSWVIAKSSGSGGLSAARAAYNAAPGAKLQLIQEYLQAATYANLSGNGDTVTSAALDGANAYLQFSSWSVGQQPTVQWINR